MPRFCKKRCPEHVVQGIDKIEKGAYRQNQKIPGMLAFQGGKSGKYALIQKRIVGFVIFFHPDCTVGFGVSPNHALRLVGYTTGRDFHPALKMCRSVNEVSIRPGADFVKYYFSRLRNPVEREKMQMKIRSQYRNIAEKFYNRMKYDIRQIITRQRLRATCQLRALVL